MSAVIYTSSTCGQCTALLKDPIIYYLQQRGAIKIFDLYNIAPRLRERIFSEYNPQRMVPFMVIGGGAKAQTFIGKDNILGWLKK